VRLSDFESHLNDPMPGFRCYACGDRIKRPTFLARVQNRVNPPAKARALSSIEKALGRVGGGFKRFFLKHDGVLLYEDTVLPPRGNEEDRAAGVFFFPVADWPAMSQEMRSGLLAMGWSKKDLTDWLRDGIVFGEIPLSANYFVVKPTGRDAGKIYYADHDSFEPDPIADSFGEFLESIITDPATFLNRLGCYTRYSDGTTDTQWIPKRYVADLATESSAGSRKKR
jgi:hypothetical protein